MTYDKLMAPDILKLPDEIDPNKMLRELVWENYGVSCPYCNEKLKVNKENKFDSICIKPRFGYAKNISIWKKFFQKEQNWERQCYTCYKCGLVWESPEYLIDNILTIEEQTNLFKKICGGWKWQ